MKPPRKPAGVRLVEKAMLENAKAAGIPSWRVYVSYYTGCMPSMPCAEWHCADNVESGLETIVFAGKKWFLRDRHTGEDTEMKGGFDEAMATARIFFTG